MTVVAVRGIYPVTEGVQTSGQGVLETLVASMRYVGSPIYHQMHNAIPLIVALCCLLYLPATLVRPGQVVFPGPS